MNYDILHIAQIISAKTLLPIHNCNITEMSFDSRQIGNAGATLFVCIKTERNDGHKFINELLAKGVKNFLIQEQTIVPTAGINMLLVENTIQALQLLAAHHRQQFSIPVIGITGSNGKTIVKEWIFQLLHHRFNIVRSPKSYNSQIGVALSLLQIDDTHNFAIIEAGISQAGEMQPLARMVQPTVGILTHMGEAHNEGFKHLQHKISEKLHLFAQCNTLICQYNIAYHDTIAQWHTAHPHCQLFTWGQHAAATLQITNIEKGNDHTIISASYKGCNSSIRIAFTDDASIENSISCWCLLLLMDINHDEIAERMMLLHIVAMRLELLNGTNNCLLINDSYNSDMGSLRIALNFMNQLGKSLSKTVIVSDILQSGISHDRLYSEMAELLHQHGVQKLIGIGTDICAMRHLFNISQKYFYKTTNDFVAQNTNKNFANELVLIKGARHFHFEDVCRLLQEQSHATILEINLNALIHNYNFYKSKLKPGTKTMCMVKAFAYGGGSLQIAATLQFHRADYLAVAYTDEGVMLRNEGITTPIMVMNPEVSAYSDIVRHGLQPELYSMRTLKLFTDYVMSHEVEKPYKVHLKLDTGMHRLGFEQTELQDLCNLLVAHNVLEVETLFSHLAASDEHSHEAFTLRQISTFKDMCSTIESQMGKTYIKHIANSSAVVQYSSAHFDMVRLGIGLHGVGNTSEENSGLQMVSRLKSSISQIKFVKAGDTVGYSRKGHVLRDSYIATIAIGYADGLSRKAGNGSYTITVNGHSAPIIGNVCMDMIMVDVTNIACTEGDEVIIFDSRESLLNLAQTMQSIPYEVLTRISQRVKRVYVHE